MPPVPFRMRLLMALTLAPAVATALGLSVVEAYRLAAPDSPFFLEPASASFAEALAQRGRGVEQAYAFIRAGADPNGLVTVQDPELTGGRSMRVSPLLLAVAARNDNAVLMLLGAGVAMAHPQNRLAACLAHALGKDEIAEALVRVGGAPDMANCPERRTDPGAPLVAWVE